MRESVQYTISYIHNRIPNEVLHMAFMQHNPYGPFTTLDDTIMTNVIHKRVLADCNIVSGRIKYIPLLPEYTELPADVSMLMPYPIGQYGLYRIPPEAREGVPITSVISISHPVNNFGGAGAPNNYDGENQNCPWVNMNQLANQVLESKTMNSTPPVPIPELLGGNMIRLNPPQLAQVNWVLGCKLAFDTELTNLNNSALIPFANLAVYAAQMYIYQELIVKIDEAVISGGAEIATIKAIVESYQDAHERYAEALLKFRGGQYLDTRQKLVFLQHMM